MPQPSDKSRSVRGEPAISAEVGALADAVGVTLGLRDDEQVFELPARLFEQPPFAVYICDRDVLFLIQPPRCRPMGPFSQTP